MTDPLANAMTRAELRRLRDAFEEMLTRQRINFFITFNFGYRIKPEIALDRMKGFCASLERKALGRNWHKHPEKDRLFVMGFPEHLDVNPHWHALARVPKPTRILLYAEGPAMWEEKLPRGQLDIKKIEGRKRPISYAMKHYYRADSRAHIFVYSTDLAAESS